MLKKCLVSAALAGSVIGILGFTAGTSSAAPNNSNGTINVDIPAGVYPSMSACFSAGDDGISEGRWVAFMCQPLSGGQDELWVGV